MVTPLDINSKSDAFRDEVVKPLFAFTDPPEEEVNTAPAEDAPAVEVNTSAWYRIAFSTSQFTGITFYDSRRTRVCVELNPEDHCFRDSMCRELRNGGWKSTDTTAWMIWDN